MMIEPLLILDELDLQPFITMFEKQTKANVALEIEMITVTCTTTGWKIKIETKAKSEITYVTPEMHARATVK